MPELWPEGIEWDDGNLSHATKHGISADEIDQVIANGPEYRRNKRGSVRRLPCLGHRGWWPARRRGGRVATSYPPRSPDHGVERGAVMARTKKSKHPDEMTEAELADYFYTHRDDLAGEEVASQPPKRMDVMISTRFSPGEAAELRAAAAQAGLSVSAFLRQSVMTTMRDTVVDLERARADLKDVYSKAADALQALSDKPPTRAQARRPRRHPAKAA
jgi:uncharacterized protein (DUF1778 family)